MPTHVPVEALPKDIVRIVQAYVREAEQARDTRMALNRRNREMLFGMQDWSHKIEGQSTESLPKIASAVEQFAAFIKKGLTSLGDWFAVELPEGLPINGEQAAKLIQSQLDKIGEQFVASGRPRSFNALLSDGVKQGLLEALVVFKVHAGPSDVARRIMQPDGSLQEYRPWRVKLDLIPTENYLPDPSGKSLYEVQVTYLDLHETQELAEEGVFDATAMSELSAEYSKPRTRRGHERYERERGQDDTTERRRMVKIEECWGTLVNTQGHIVEKGVVCAVANDRHLIRPPEPNPYWHGESCFITSPIIRVPHSVWHKALYDDAAALNAAQNELFNLMLDGGLAAVWGIKELRLGMLEDVNQVSGGIRQGMTLVLKDDAPMQQQALTASDTGDIPQEALALYNILDREFQAASMTNDLKMGMLPPKQVKATEIVEAQQSTAITLDAIVQDIETELIAPLLRKVWLVILQNLENFDAREVVDVIGMESAYALMSMSPDQRFNELAQATFKVHGISGLLARARDFQKLLGLLQLVFQNPMLLQAFMQKYSINKVLDQLIKLANIKTESIKITAQEMLQQMLGMGVPGLGMGVPGMGTATPPGAGNPNALPSLPNPEEGPGPTPPAEGMF